VVGQRPVASMTLARAIDPARQPENDTPAK